MQFLKAMIIIFVEKNQICFIIHIIIDAVLFRLILQKNNVCFAANYVMYSFDYFVRV